MKKLILILTLICSITALAREGVGNGGDLIKARREKIVDFLRNSFPMRPVFNEIKLGLNEKSHLPIRDEKARNILTKIMALQDWLAFDKVIWEVDISPYGPHVTGKRLMYLRVKENGSCIDQKTNEARTSALISNNPLQICISLDELAKQTDDSFSIEANGKTHLSLQIPALIIHELAHAAGYDEPEAEYIQEYIRTQLMAGCSMGLKDYHAFFNAYSSKDPFVFGRIKIGVQVSDDYINSPALNVQSENILVQTSYFSKFDSMNIAKIYTPNSPKSKNNPDGFELSFSHEGGFIKFKIRELDGKLTDQSFSWKKIEGSGYYNAIYRLDEVNLNINGHRYTRGNVGFFRIDQSCWNR